jgi:hypothetical protein
LICEGGGRFDGYTLHPTKSPKTIDMKLVKTPDKKGLGMVDLVIYAWRAIDSGSVAAKRNDPVWSRRRTMSSAVREGAGGFVGAKRAESWAGEVRLNLVRLAALLGFYGYHLVNVFLSRDDPSLASPYHVSVTALVMVWSVGVVVLWLYLSRHWAPPALKYVVTAWDALLITTLLVLAAAPPGPQGGAPRSPLVILYFLVIAAAPLRLSLRLVYAATLVTLAAYGFLLGHYAFFVVGAERYYAEPSWRIPRTQEVIFALGLLGAGALAGQVVRQARRLLEGVSDNAGSLARDAEFQRDTKLIAAGLVGMALLVALGLVLAASVGLSFLGSSSTLAILAPIVVVFVIAVVAALVEARRPGNLASNRLWTGEMSQNRDKLKNGPSA